MQSSRKQFIDQRKISFFEEHFITPHWMLSHLSVVLLGIRMKLYTLPNSDDPNLWQT